MRNRTLADLDRVVALGAFAAQLARAGMDWDAFSHHFRLWVLV